jgi:hypothetical protein
MSRILDKLKRPFEMRPIPTDTVRALFAVDSLPMGLYVHIDGCLSVLIDSP